MWRFGMVGMAGCGSLDERQAFEVADAVVAAARDSVCGPYLELHGNSENRGSASWVYCSFSGVIGSQISEGTQSIAYTSEAVTWAGEYAGDDQAWSVASEVEILAESKEEVAFAGTVDGAVDRPRGQPYLTEISVSGKGSLSGGSALVELTIVDQSRTDGDGGCEGLAMSFSGTVGELPVSALEPVCYPVP